MIDGKGKRREATCKPRVRLLAWVGAIALAACGVSSHSFAAQMPNAGENAGVYRADAQADHQAYINQQKKMFKERKREIRDSLYALLESPYADALDEQDYFVLTLIVRCLPSGIEEKPDWDGFKNAIDTCDSVEDLVALLYSNYVGFTGVVPEAKQKEDIIPMAETALELAGFSDLPYRAYFPKTSGVIFEKYQRWEIIAGQSYREEVEGTRYVSFTMNAKGTVSAFHATSNIFTMSRVAVLTEEQRQGLYARAKELQRICGEWDHAIEEVQFSEYTYDGMPGEAVAWISIPEKTNEQGERFMGGYFLLGVEHGKLYTYVDFGCIPDENHLQVIYPNQN